jgi:F420-0:gamma-glutamyl ligase-like protein
MDYMNISANPNKNLIIEVDNKKYARIPIKTHLITERDKDYSEIIKKYAQDYLQPGDIIFIGERSLASCQGRSIPKADVKPSRLARFLVRFVTKSPYGIGLGSPETMQLAVEEVGAARMLLAAFFAAITKPFGIKGFFYKVAGPQAKAVDGAADYVIPPYNTYVSKAPRDPQKTAEEISEKIGFPTAIVDVCDLGGWVMGASQGINKNFIVKVLKDNPLGQTTEQTPFGLIREVKD